jgi:hypothetical protein
MAIDAVPCKGNRYEQEAGFGAFAAAPHGGDPSSGRLLEGSNPIF